MKIRFPGGMRVEAEYRGHTIQTDQSETSGGAGSAPSPFDLFLASLGTCTGYYVLAFCRKRDIPTDEIELTMERTHNEEKHLIERIDIVVHLPETFPERYANACIKSAAQCTVKKHLQDPPEIAIAAHRAA